MSEDTASRGGPGETWDGRRHGPPSAPVPEPLSGEPDAEEWGEAMRTAREEYPKAKSVELWWRLGVFVAMVRERGRVSVVNIPRRRARHPRG